MAYVPTELRLIVTNLTSNAGGVQIWSLDSTDPAATADTAGYISDATARGVRVGDLVIFRQFSSLSAKTTLQMQKLMSVRSITAGAADLSDGADIWTTNTD